MIQKRRKGTKEKKRKENNINWIKEQIICFLESYSSHSMVKFKLI